MSQKLFNIEVLTMETLYKVISEIGFFRALFALTLCILAFGGVSFFADSRAKPGTEVSILWGLAEYTKEVENKSNYSFDESVIPVSNVYGILPLPDSNHPYSSYLLLAPDYGIIKFEINSASISHHHSKIIEIISKDLKRYSFLKLTLVGHSSTDENNGDELSFDRVNAVRHMMIANGVRSENIETKYHGVKFPVATDQTTDGRSLNRRVEITLKPLPSN